MKKKTARKSKRPAKLKDISENPKGVFCTTCGEELAEYCFTDQSKNLEAIKRHHEECKKKKRFKGEFCSRLFISDPGLEEIPWEDFQLKKKL